MAGEHHEPDGIAESVEDLLRSGLLLGTRLAERRIRAREQALRDAARDSLDRAQTERDRQRLEREQALAQLQGVFSDSWWEHASAEDIRRAWTIARPYQHEDAHAARGVWQIADQLPARYGLDPFEIDPAALGTQTELESRAPLTGEELPRCDRQLARLRGQLDADERAPDDGLAEQHLRARRAEIDEIRDLIAAERGRTISETPEQRLAERLATLDLDAEAVRTAVLADAANAQPPETAAASEPRPTPRARVSSQARRGRRQARRPR